MIFFVPDLEDYRDNLRGFYFDFENEAPGPLLKTTDEVIKQIELINTNSKEVASIASFYEKFCYLENGESAKKLLKKFSKRDYNISVYQSS